MGKRAGSSSRLELVAALSDGLSRGRPVDALLRWLFTESGGVDRVYVLGEEVRGGRLRSRFTWALTGGAPPHRAFDAADLGPLGPPLRRGEALAHPARDFAPETQAILDDAGILSLCLVPVRVLDGCFGLVAFADCQEARAYSDEEVSFLRTTAALLGGHLARARMRTLLVEAEAQHRKLVDNLHEIIFETAADTTITFLNRAWERRLGYAVEESLGTSMVDYLAPEGREAAEAEVFAAVAAGDESCLHEASYVAKSGERRWMQVFCHFTRDEQGALTGMLGTMTDITDQRWAEEAIRRHQLDESLSTLAGGIAHDLNNVLHGMLGAVEILKRDHAADPAAADLLDAIQTSGERMGDMTRQLLAYARGGRYEAAVLDVSAVLRDALKLASLPPQVRVTVDTSPPARVEGDRGLLFQVLLNLIINAFESMEQGGELRIEVDAVTLESSDPLVRQWTLRPGPYVRLSFIDGGGGIEPLALKRIFEPFFSTKARGRGLGLAAARGIVAKHSGAITVESELGRGSTFRVFLPRHDGELESPAAESGRDRG